MRAERRARVPQQRGFFLIEAMVAILIFALGILGLVAMGGTAVSSQSDAQYRTEASSIADAIAGEIALGIDRTTEASKVATLAAFAHQPSPDPSTLPAPCAFTGAAIDGAAKPGVQALLDRANSGGPLGCRVRPWPTSRSSSTPPAPTTASSSRCAGRPRATRRGGVTRS